MGNIKLSIKDGTCVLNNAEKLMHIEREIKNELHKVALYFNSDIFIMYDYYFTKIFSPSSEARVFLYTCLNVGLDKIAVLLAI